MSQGYLPLYRKYRPQSFSDLIGQDGLTKALSNAINLKKIAHAYLFCGPRGTGKTSSARIFAKSLNCTNGPTITPCNTCPSCVNITNSTPVDVIEIDAASNRSVEDTQKILEKIQYVPVQGKFKIYIIDEVHMLSTTAFNSLLKTLEEPPENVIFILATTESHKVLETIISRCQRFDFRRIRTIDIVKSLSEIAEKEEIKITQDAVFSIAKNSQGGMRDALALLDQVSIYGIDREITQADIDNLLGRLSVDKLFEITQTFIESSPQSAITIINRVYDDGQEPTQIINSLILYHRNLLILKNSTSIENIIELTQLDEANVEKMKPQSDALNTKSILHNIDRLSHYLKQIKTSTNRQMWLELCAIELSSDKSTKPNILPVKQVVEIKTNPIKPVEKIAQNTKAIEQAPIQIEQKPSISSVQPQIQQEEAAEPVTQKQEQPTAPSTTQSTDSWSTILGKINSIPAKMFFNGLATPIEISPEIVKLAFANENLISQAKMEVKYNAFESACKEVLGVDKIRVDFTVAKQAEKKTTTTQKAAPPKAMTNPMVKQDTNEPSPMEKAESPPTQEKIAIEQDIEDDEPNIVDEIPPTANLVEYSEQARMFADVFNGKIMDQRRNDD